MMAKKLQMCGTETEMREQVGKICRNYLHGAWKTVTPQELEFKRISGGLSNFLYYIALPETKSTTSYAPSSPNRSDPEVIRELSPETPTLEHDAEKKSPISRFLKHRALSRSNSFNIEEPKKVLLRIYGQVHGERAMDAIITEAVIFTLLSERKLGPKLHGVFSGGRIEEYIPARPLLTRELAEPALSMKIAEKMAAIHSMDVPLTKEPTWLWKTMGRWVKTAYERLENEAKDDIERKVLPRLKAVDWDKEISWLKSYLATVNSPVVFCHNDMQEGNILMREDDNTIQHNPDDDINDFHPYQHDQDETMPTPDIGGAAENKSDKENNHTPGLEQGRGQGHHRQCLHAMRLQFADEDANTTDSMISHSSDNGEPKLVLIDFEYCSYNYRGFDIANHFVEWTYDYTNPQYPFYHQMLENYPTLEQKEIFLRQYLKHYNTIVLEDPSEDANPSIEEVNALNSEVEALTLASHLMWSLWGIVNATKSQITFGYWEYALARLENYQRLKLEIIKKGNLGIPHKRKIEEVDI